MLEQFLPSSVVMISLAAIAGLILGGLCVEALRRNWPTFPRAPLMGIVAYGGGMMLGGTLLGGCVLFLGGAAQVFPPLGPPTSTRTPTAGIITFTPSVTPRSTLTPEPPPTIRTPITTTATATLTVTPRPLPSPFNITLFASGEAVCKAKDFNAPYRVTIQGTAMSLLQVNANITTTGPYNAATGAFTTTKAGLPGLETYTGLIRFDGTKIQMSGTYSYTNDPNLPCKFGPWNIFGETTVP